MRITVIVVSTQVMISAGCTAEQLEQSEPTDWRVSIAMPSFYPVKVTQAYGVNEKYDWTSMLHGFTQFMTISKLDSVQRMLPDYDGFGLPVQTVALTSRQQVMPTNVLPDTLYLYWVSLINNGFYATEFKLTEEVKMLAKEKITYTRSNGFVDDRCYRTEFVFGMLPNGHAKVWLKGCDQLIYIDDLEPAVVSDRDSFGYTAEVYDQSSYKQRIKKRAEEAGATIDPIPWDKVNRVYANFEIKTLN
ncbi:DUF2931 family protein [Vibrio sp. SCSIO 43135]|uniref:DUF2931 family protein n=1 Tax=Vibrio sp. SCSIO 43135 TaxID=2819096 RepID=UPI00207570C0|nr:DUF2931 family protein [Vibrio sp. SCSIO 43135]USD40070.1 DUF2931 family protein [Vibrio sp. SCSIO 43135]